ncbi:hypothetical protein ALP97_200161 [Pseudomonas salomonii]|uniref:Uncharacterized protein n=1 Tax=Pseudomonas salomonii TaxID=191391 RepID=A0A3M4QBY1_9PSED|nr:hypothetical protein ALP97_200161 [Pseudomonas salomonii]
MHGIPYTPSQNGGHRARAEHDVQVSLVRASHDGVALVHVARHVAVFHVEFSDVDAEAQIVHLPQERGEPGAEAVRVCSAQVGLDAQRMHRHAALFQGPQEGKHGGALARASR